MKTEVNVLTHSSIKITGKKVIYIDPFKIAEETHDADYIFCTHSHYDHYSPNDIMKIKKEDTVIIVVEELQREALNLDIEVMTVVPDEEYEIDDIEFKTTYAYNKTKSFHPKENKWVGYIINVEGDKYYIVGDTDNIPEIQNIECNIALIPIGGTYTMDYKEAAELANSINADIVIPTHYGSIVGTKEDALKFKKLVQEKEVKILI